MAEKTKINGLRRRPKKSGTTQLPLDDARGIFFVAVDTFKRHNQYSRFMVSAPVAEKLHKGRVGYKKLMGQLEDFRCAFGIDSPQVFYNMVAEFMSVPNGVKYYPVNHVFSGLEVTEEFLSRVWNTLVWTFDIYDSKDILETKIVWFADQLRDATRCFESGIERKHKDWYCLSAILRLLVRKGWSEAEFFNKVKVRYRNRMKKLTGEMLLFDLTHGELDAVKQPEPKPQKKNPKIIDTLTSQEGHKDWVKQVHENKITFNYEKREY